MSHRALGSILVASLAFAVFATPTLSRAEEQAASDPTSSGACTYPKGPYGLAKGDILPPNLSWKGFAPGATTVSTITSASFFDCDGSKGINAFLIDVSAEWCPSCQEEANPLDANLAGKWGKDGVVAVTLMVEDNARAPATTETAREWIDGFGLTKNTVAADPDNTFSVSALPTNFLVDPRTMTIVSVVEGYDDTDNGPDTLALKNKK
jgi:hypothetical protein